MSLSYISYSSDQMTLSYISQSSDQMTLSYISAVIAGNNKCVVIAMCILFDHELRPDDIVLHFTSSDLCHNFMW